MIKLVNTADNTPENPYQQRQAKAHFTLKQALGNKLYKQHMQLIGAKGGKAKVAKGFAVTRKQINNYETSG